MHPCLTIFMILKTFERLIVYKDCEKISIHITCGSLICWRENALLIKIKYVFTLK